MQPAYVLKCLGQPELRGPDGKLVRFRVKKHLALLVLLSVERRQAHERDRLVDLLWPRAARAQGRHSLANALSLLRSIFGRTAFLGNRPAVRFDPPALVLDLDRLGAGNILGPDGEDPLEVDGFLRGFDLPDAPEFGLWKEREHARWLPSIHAGLLTLIDQGRRRGSHEEIMARAERLLALDHLAEEGVRAKMEALALAGDRFSALRVFDEWKTLLTGELGAEPSSLVEGMAGQLRKRGWEPREPMAMPAVPAEQWRDRKFVGRGREFRKLYETWETTHQFRPRHLYVVGDSGVGKTTLAQRLVTAAGLEGASVSRVQCYHLEQKLPFAAIGGLVSGLLGKPGVPATAPEALAEIARIVPQVREHFPGLPDPKPSAGETARLLFAEGVMDLLTAVMDERPLLLVLDDYTLADEASLAVLHLLLRRLDRGRYMVVITARPVDEAESHQARRIREGMARLSMEAFQLDPMSEEETTELLEVILEERSARPRAPERRALVRASRGFPMALELLTQDWQIYGARSLALAFAAMTKEFGADRTPQEDAYELLAVRIIVTLSHSARQVLTLAALLGGRASDLSLFGLVDLSFGQTVEGISELTTKRILRSVGAGLEFINELVRAHVYRQIAGPIRTALHAAIADRLVALEAAGQAIPGLEIAWHLMRAGRIADATPRLFRGAAEAKDRGAPDEALLALESALPQLDPSSQTRGRVVLADLHQELGRWTDSLDVLAEVEVMPDELRNEGTVLEIHARWNLGELDGPNQRQALISLLSMLQVPDSAREKAYILAARLARDTADPGLMRSVLDTIPESVAEPSSSSVLVRIGRALLHFHLREVESCRRLVDLVLPELDQRDRADAAAARLVMGIAVVQASAGDYESALVTTTRALRIARRLDNDTAIGQIQSNAAVSNLRLTRYAEALTAARDARSRLQTPRASGYLMKAIEMEGIAAALLGRTSDALAVVADGDRLAVDVSAPWYFQDWLLSKADILWVLGKRPAALEAGRLATTGQFEYPGDIGLTGPHTRWLGRTAILECRSEVALDRVVLLAPEIDRFDALDRVEVLATVGSLETAVHGFVTNHIQETFMQAVARLPAAVCRYLEGLGVLGAS